MRRRGFLAALVGVFAAPAAAAAAAAAKLPARSPANVEDTLVPYERTIVIDQLRRPLSVVPVDGSVTLTGSEESLFAGHRWRDDELRALQREANRRASLALNKLVP